MSHPIDEIPEPVSHLDETAPPNAPPAPLSDTSAARFEVEEQMPDGGRPSAPALSPTESTLTPTPEPEPAAASPAPQPAAVTTGSARSDDDEPPPQLVWYVLKVQSSREDTI